MSINLIRYTVIYVLAITGLMAISFALQVFTNIEMPTGVSTVLPVMMAAMLEGQRYARETKQPIEPNDAWKAALAATGVVIVVSILLVAVFFVFVPGFAGLFAALGSVGLLIVLTISLVIVLLANRFALTMGAKNELKAQAKRST
ncbi:MAG: ABZJ_00895 family protein [Pelagimonas sp.]|uniref:ABZJ_00895 family protein n=1 Tax=Pelagimonas sp. TaxID=2073170 RepID=UPI003D6B2276